MFRNEFSFKNLSLFLPIILFQFIIITIFNTVLSATYVFTDSLIFFLMMYIFVYFSYLFQKYKSPTLEKRYDLQENKFLIYINLYLIILFKAIFYSIFLYLMFLLLNDIGYVSDYDFLGWYGPLVFNLNNLFWFIYAFFFLIIGLLVFTDFTNRFISNKYVLYGMYLIIIMFLFFTTSFYGTFTVVESTSKNAYLVSHTEKVSTMSIVFEILLPFQIFSDYLSIFTKPEFYNFDVKVLDFSEFKMAYVLWWPYLEIIILFLVTNLIKQK